MENGVKDCSGCLIPHRKDNYDDAACKISQDFAHGYTAAE